MPKPFNVIVIASQEFQIRVDAINEAEALKFGENAVEDGEGEFVETTNVEAIGATEYVPE